MAVQPVHDTWNDPTWQVLWIFDEDDASAGFAYTVGLHDRGMPEVQIRCAPSLGDDPAPDWRFSGRDMGAILNDVGARLLSGAIDVGCTWEEEYDGGLVTVAFRVDPAEPAEDLEAYQVHREATVLPVRWALRRAPRGARRDPDPDECTALEVELAEVPPSPRSAVPGRWRAPARRTWSADQRYGPRTPIVRAVAASLWTSPPRTLVEAVVLGTQVERGGGRLTWPVTLAAAQAWPLGLDDAVQRAVDDVHATAARHRPGATSGSWESVVDAVACGSVPDRRLERNLRHVVADLLSAVVAVEVVGSAASEQARLAALGPWAHAGLPPGVPAGPEWTAGPAVVRRLDELLARLGDDARATVARLHDARLEAGRDERLLGMLTGWAVTGAAAAPSRPGVHPDWATSLTTALTFRLRLTAEQVRDLAGPYVDVLPTLEDWLNDPV